MHQRRRPEGGHDFIKYHLGFERVKKTWDDSKAELKKLFREAGASFPIRGIFIRIFKDEEIVELWGRDFCGRYRLITEYPICTMSGTLGPKRKEGDLQIPEGFYYIERFNPLSRYHLSLGINYPNHSDRILGDDKEPGKDIFIHGDCVSVGCIPITDKLIKQLYVAAVLAKGYGQVKIPFHIFPMRLLPNALNALDERFDDPELSRFWHNLKDGYDIFEHTRIPPWPSVDTDTGLYIY
ncbi:MAG: murein L,D-transpeptidase family protein [Candidatus Zixiibacteriota bacterium]